MFDIGWSELLVVATVAIIVVGPKDLPRMLRSLGKTMGQVRRMSNDFKRQFDDALREAERQSGLDETKKELQAMTKVDPIKDVQKDLNKTLAAADKKVADKKVAEKPAEAATPAASPAATEAAPEEREAEQTKEPEQAKASEPAQEPAKTSAAAAQGSDAA